MNGRLEAQIWLKIKAEKAKGFDNFILKFLSFWVESKAKDKKLLILGGCRVFLKNLLSKGVGLGEI